MEYDLIISGYGGQGSLFAGTLLANTAIEEKKHTTWLPSYGREKRGGPSNCTVIVSDEEIDSPYIESPNYVIALNTPALKKYEHKIKSGGLVMVNSSMAEEKLGRNDINYVFIPASEIAKEIGEVRYANIVLLGAFIQKTKAVSIDNTLKAAVKIMSSRQNLIKINCDALNAGSEFIKKSIIPE